MVDNRASVSRPIIAITMGDPCGIGPEILVKTFLLHSAAEDFVPLIVGDPRALERAAGLLGAPRKFSLIQDVQELSAMAPRIPVMAPCELTWSDLAYGHPSEDACRASVQYIEVAAELALQGKVQAICTCPIHKANLHQCGFPFPGHTEFLKDLTQAESAVMMLAGPRLKVALATIHMALGEVPRVLNRSALTTVIAITGRALLRDFAIAAPRLAVAALNPHAGEAGRFGSEELETIEPVVELFTEADFTVSGPYPADTLFYRALHGEFDAVVAMYHDQGLIPVKLVHFHDAVNVTLGLPIIRTSVDHGTAYDLVGTGKARAGSLRAAVRMAGLLARNRFCGQ